MNSGNTGPILDQYQTGTSSNFEVSSGWNHFFMSQPSSFIIIFSRFPSDIKYFLTDRK